MIVKPMFNRGDKPVANQHIIETEEGQFFQSYDSMIAFKSNDGELSLSMHWDYSRTTMKYLGQFAGLNAAEIRKGLKSGEIKTNLSIYGELVK